ncbi:MAG: DUF1648 domain-containing protein [Armatimonadetes bacterium]|nr:DUF1648 domain-containing protein [Armatimonadota bacterium]
MARPLVRALGWLPLLTVVAAAGWILVHYAALPALVPSHFGLSGWPDAYAGKATLFVLPGIVLGLDLLLGLLGRHPEWGNYPVEVTEHNRARLHSQFRGLMLTTRVLMALTLNSMAILTVEIARQHLERLSPVWIGICIGALLIGTITSAWRMRR